MLYPWELVAETPSVIFVVDASGSMSVLAAPFMDVDGRMITQGSKLDRAKDELRRGLRDLPAHYDFNVVIFDGCFRTIFGARVRATAENKAHAEAFLHSVQPDGWTNIGGGVAGALADRRNGTVVLLSDGQPNFLDCAATYVGTLDEHLALIGAENLQRARIHVLGVEAVGSGRAFLQRIAADNRGTYFDVW